jgi:hypothetical protein
MFTMSSATGLDDVFSCRWTERLNGLSDTIESSVVHKADLAFNANPTLPAIYKGITSFSEWRGAAGPFAANYGRIYEIIVLC